MKIRNELKILFLLFVVLGVYYPAIFGGINLIDDSRLFNDLEDTPHFSLKEIFFPGNSHYYRPIVILTFFIDKYLWGLDPSFMHLENVVIHAVNVVLLFLVARRLLSGTASEDAELPLLAALLFALHPINTEAVNWIAGRTDPLATLFVLASLLVFLKGIENERTICFSISATLLFCGYLVKEVAVFFFPALFVIMWARKEPRSSDYFKQRGMLVRVFLPFAVATLMYFVLRKFGLQARDGSAQILMRESGEGILSSVTSMLCAFGFYVKKLMLPLPLNFSIDHYSKNYVWLGGAASVLLLLTLLKRRPASGLFASASLLLAPAILVATKKIAWTPVAERYLYAPSAFFVLGACGALALFFRRAGTEKLMVPAAIAVILPAAWITSERNIIWQDHLSLYQDTVRKSPDFARARNEYGYALIEHGRLDEAIQAFELAKKNDRNNYLLYVNQAGVYYMRGDYAKAREILQQNCVHKIDANPEVLKMMARIEEKKLFSHQDAKTRRRIMADLTDTYSYLYTKTHDPFFLYRSGQLYLSTGDREKAAECFAKVAREAPDDAYFKAPAAKLAKTVLAK